MGLTVQRDIGVPYNADTSTSRGAFLNGFSFLLVTSAVVTALGNVIIFPKNDKFDIGKKVFEDFRIQ